MKLIFIYNGGSVKINVYRAVKYGWARLNTNKSPHVKQRPEIDKSPGNLPV